MKKEEVLNCLKKLQEYFEVEPCKPPPEEPLRALVWENVFKNGMDPKWYFKEGPLREALNTTEHAYINNKGNLQMDCVPRGTNERPLCSYLRTWDSKRPQTYLDDNHSIFVGPQDGPITIEFNINLSQSYGVSQGAWFALWLFCPDTFYGPNHEIPWVDGLPRLCAYDGDPSTGLEIDIMEYAPRHNSNYRINGFNSAAWVTKEKKKEPDTGDVGYFENIQDVPGLQDVDFKQDRFWKFETKLSKNKVEMFLEGIKYWEITDPDFIPTQKTQALVMSWEVSNGLWGDVGPTFQEIGKTMSVEIESVRIWKDII